MSFLGTTVEAIGKAVNAIVPGFENLTKQSEDKDYNAFQTRIFNSPEYAKFGNNNDAKAIQLKTNLSKWIKDALGPMQYGDKIKSYLRDPNTTNDKLFELVKFLSKNREKFQGIITELSGIDETLYKGITKETEGLVKSLLDLQVNALLALAHPGVAPVIAEPIKALADEVKKKIDAVNKLLQVTPLAGGSNADPDLIKYMKYKAKYLKLKSKMQ